jgi:hypothetical protein
MTKNYFRLLFIACMAFAVKAAAQCTSCTTTISGADAAPHIIASGQTYCVTSTGSMSGLITIQSGGTLCNQGSITSSNIWVNGGTLTNYGTINTARVLVDAQGGYSNNGSADIDSLLVQNIYSTFTNNGSLTGIRLAFADNANGTNNGTITEDFMGDSVAQFNNNPAGSLTLNYDMYNAYNSGFFNDGFMSIGRDFLNSTGAIFQTGCMISVGRDWYNSSPAVINGPPTGSCGGFSITGGSYNTGTIGSSGQHVDICDAGNPPLGLDGPGGTIASTTTHCTCSNVCMAVGIAEHNAPADVLIATIYPNPAKDKLTLELSSSAGQNVSVGIMDMMGRKHKLENLSVSPGRNKTSVDISMLAAGSYILVVTDEKGRNSQQLFTVVK